MDRKHYLKPTLRPTAFVLRTAESGCIEYHGKNGRGKPGGNLYGEISLFGKKKVRISTHRLFFQVFKGPIPYKPVGKKEPRNGFVVRHTCDNPPCVNPEHLLLGTDVDNLQDAKIKGRLRGPSGARSIHGILTEEQVRRIWDLHAKGLRQFEIAAEIGIRRQNVFAVIRGRAWKRSAPSGYVFEKKFRRGERKEFCKRGHPRAGPGANVYTKPDGIRDCRACRRERASGSHGRRQ